jgi:hypothetical protein
MSTTTTAATTPVATELRVTGLSYEMWLADLPDISAANCLIL